jgi:hypothetical protein
VGRADGKVSVEAPGRDIHHDLEQVRALLGHKSIETTQL